ncbi:hypothetical protein VNO77_27743 [Canavalia gladiata]|uniref:Uncharacterized protein n=1 Tax=Canavalia gladiata TaxID=3824 RepID=A0AAN9Q4E0_CANGL
MTWLTLYYQLLLTINTTLVVKRCCSASMLSCIVFSQYLVSAISCKGAKLKTMQILSYKSHTDFVVYEPCARSHEGRDLGSILTNNKFTFTFPPGQFLLSRPLLT